MILGDLLVSLPPSQLVPQFPNTPQLPLTVEKRDQIERERGVGNGNILYNSDPHRKAYIITKAYLCM
jgi:hypothetical protein